MDKNCIICGNDKSKRLYNMLLKCTHCGFVWADLDLDKKNIEEIYRDSFFFNGEYVDYLKEEEALRKNFRRNLELISKFIPMGRLLEIGCAYGFFLDIAKERYEVQGIEINQNACQYARKRFKLDIICGDFLETEFNENYYDIVAMWATLEHLKEPHLYIKKISRLLKENGIFVCSTPDIDSFLGRIQRHRWRLINIPAHLSYFSRETLKGLLDKNELELVYAARLGEYRTINNALYIMLVLRNKLFNLYSGMKRLGLNKGLFYLNTYDILYTIAAKRRKPILR